jgi:hypothetical protein
MNAAYKKRSPFRAVSAGFENAHVEEIFIADGLAILLIAQVMALPGSWQPFNSNFVIVYISVVKTIESLLLVRFRDTRNILLGIASASRMLRCNRQWF